MLSWVSPFNDQLRGYWPPEVIRSHFRPEEVRHSQLSFRAIGAFGEMCKN